MLPAGIEMAKARRPATEKLIREDPRRAVTDALTFDQWAALPDEMKAEVERPFSVSSDYTYYPICHEPGTQLQAGEPAYVATLAMPDGSSLQTFSYGRREGVMSKRALPVQGITLAGAAAMRDGTLQIVGAAELTTVRTLFPDGQADMTRSLTSGTPVDGSAVYALSGGRLYAFASQKEAQALDSKLAELDALPGPFAASSLLAASADLSGGGSLNIPQIEVQALAQSSSWTESKKRLFLIRINFTDKPEEPVSLSSVESVMAQSSEMIRLMSYGKTWVETKASTNVYTMPQTLAYYSTTPNIVASEPMLMRDARNTFRQQKSGADAAINIGPVSALANGDGGGLGDYDIVGFYRSTMDGEGAGGGAGGSFLLVKGAWANTVGLFTHEWGHNYGLHHSSLWKTTDGSVDGAGAIDEYGDPFDNMGTGRLPEAHFRPEGKAALGWLAPDQWTDVSSGSGTFRIYRIDDPAVSSSPRAIRVAKGGNATQYGYYWIGHRGAFSDNPRMGSGAYLTARRPGETRSLLLDTTPNSIGDVRDSALAMGSTFADPLSAVFITPIGHGGNGSSSYIDVRVNMGPLPGNSAPQAGQILGPVNVMARVPVSYTVSGSDPDGDTLAYAWNTGERTPEAQSNSPTLQAQWDTGGTYELKVSVSDMKGGLTEKTLTVQVDDPLDHWTTGNVGRSVSMVGAQSGNGVVMGLGYWAELFLSWDGIAWTEINHGTGLQNWTRLAYGNGVFVMSGQRSGETSTRIAYSTDGRIWNMAQVPDGVPALREIAFGGGKFVALGEGVGGTVLWSADGKSWSRVQVSGSPEFRCLAWNGSAWLATAINRENLWWEIAADPSNDWWNGAWTSPDGVSWQQLPNIGQGGERVFGLDGVFYFETWYGGLQRSTDNGQTWQSAALPMESSTWSWSVRNVCVAPDGTLAANAIEHLPAGNQNVLLISMDGMHWSRATSPEANSAVTSANTIVFGAGRLLTFSNDGVVKYSQPLSQGNAAPVVSASSIGGATNARGVVSLTARAADPEGDAVQYYWDFGSELPILEGADAKIILPFGGSYDVTLRVVDSNGGVTTSNQTLTLNDPALSFTMRAKMTYDMQAIAANNSLAVAVGNAVHPIMTSTNGVTWTTRFLPESAYLSGVVWDGSKFITVGHSWFQNAWVSTIYTSPDGLTWTRRHAVGPELWTDKKVASSSTVALAAIGNGVVLRSPDGGFNWNTIQVPGLASSGVRALIWSGKEFAMLTDNATVKLLTSTDGLQWTDRTSGIGLDATWKSLWGLSWLNDRFVASGWYSNIRTSKDGAQTFTATRLSGNVELPVMAYGNGIYFGAGWDHETSQDVDVFSNNGDDWYSYPAGTTNDRTGAVFFKNTFITVDRGGEIRQSGVVTAPQNTFSLLDVGEVSWDGTNSAAVNKFLAQPGQRRTMQYSHDLSLWLTHGEIESGPLGVFETNIRQAGDQRAKWGKSLFFRLQ